MKIFKLMAIALVAMVGLNSCSKDCDHDFIEVDHSKDLVGTWTCLTADYAEALVIKADGSALSTGVEDGEYWENVAGKIVVKNGKVTMTFEDGDNFEGHIDVIAGMAFSIYNEDGERMTYNYCANDLADEIVGMWVCNDGPNEEKNDMNIHTYNEDGTVVITGFAPDGSGFHNQGENTYKVVGNLVFTKVSALAELGISSYVCMSLKYAHNGTELGDVLYTETYLPMNANDVAGVTQTFLRVNQYLDLAGKKYDYNDIYVTNVKGLDKDIDFIEGVKFNFAKMDGSMMDEILKSILFAVEFPDAQTFKYSCRYPEQNTFMEADMVVDGNKMTVKISPRNAAFRDIEMYVFQDADCSQMHMYMPTYAFINFFGNMQATMMAQMGQLDLTDAAAVNAIYDSIDDAVDTINVSFTFKAAK